MRFVINWTHEREQAHEFLKSDRAVMHVVGDDHCMPPAFVKDIVDQLGASRPSVKIPVVSPDVLRSNTPYGALRELASALGLEYAPRKSPQVQLDLLSNNRSRRQDVVISDIDIDLSIEIPQNEIEEVSRLTDLLTAEVASGKRFDNIVVLFKNCHRFDTTMLRLLYANVWEPVIAPMTQRGAKSIFQYSPRDITYSEGTIPPPEGDSIRLPSAFSPDVADEIADKAIEHGWEFTREAALGLARAVLRSSETVEEAQSRMLLIHREAARDVRR